MLAKVFLAFTALCTVSPAIAQSQAPVALSFASSALIKKYDPSVSPVQMVSPATPGQKTACGDMPEMNAIYCGADKTVYFGADLMKMSYENMDQWPLSWSPHTNMHTLGSTLRQAL